MTRVLAWVVFLALLVGVVKLVRTTGNPWNPAQALPSVMPSPAAVRIPGCGDKLGCLP